MTSIVIEIVKNQRSILKKENLIENCKEYLRTNEISPGTFITKFNKPLTEHVNCIIVDDSEKSGKLDFASIDVKWHVYSLHNTGGQADHFADDNDGECTTISTNWMLPASEFHGVWENLIYDTNIKDDLLHYVSTMMIFSEKGVDPNIICSNRVVLLHGPPGTGKTSLCKALAHKLSVRLQHRYTHGQLIEINSHSLFSKWFSESGKLVTKMFSRIVEFAEDPKMLVCILIDEIESLAHARTQCLSGNEPSDAIRVVNAVLTQIDRIKKYPNVLILTTSNMTTAIDLALVDRADIKQFIGLPTKHAIYQIYYSCIQELMRTDVISPASVILPGNAIRSVDVEVDCPCEYSKRLMKICESSAGFSGRSLRKVPFIAHALFIKTDSVSLDKYLDAMVSAVDYLKKEKHHFENL